MIFYHRRKLSMTPNSWIHPFQSQTTTPTTTMNHHYILQKQISNFLIFHVLNMIFLKILY